MTPKHIQVLTSEIRELIGGGFSELYEYVDDTLADVDDHGTSSRELIIKHISTGKFYCLEYEVHKSSGPVLSSKAQDLYEVIPVEKVVITWRRI